MQSFPTLSVLYRTHPAKRLPDVFVVVPVDIFFGKGKHLVASMFLPTPGDGPPRLSSARKKLLVAVSSQPFITHQYQTIPL